MPTSPARSDASCNRLLASLGDDEYRDLAPDLQAVHLHRKQVVGERCEAAEYVYFPCGGVHRPSVSLVAGAYQQAGFIKYSRGWMQILDRAGLEEASCECYAASKLQFEQVLARS